MSGVRRFWRWLGTERVVLVSINQLVILDPTEEEYQSFIERWGADRCLVFVID